MVLNAFKPSLANGALVDIGVYCIAPLIELFGMPNSLQATGVRLDSGVDAEGSIQLAYEHMTATVIYSKVTTSYVPTEIQGEAGTICIDKISYMFDLTLQNRN